MLAVNVDTDVSDSIGIGSHDILWTHGYAFVDPSHCAWSTLEREQLYSLPHMASHLAPYAFIRMIWVFDFPDIVTQ